MSTDPASTALAVMASGEIAQILSIPLDRLYLDPGKPNRPARIEEMAASISEVGGVLVPLLVPLLVRPYSASQAADGTGAGSGLEQQQNGQWR